jgi:branched-chain amino acid transport system substrate-binding protein
VSKKFVFSVVGLALAATTMSACSSSSGGGGGSGSGPIVLGASVSTTGAYASSGTNVANGYQAAVDVINKSGGVLGRKLKLETVDDKSDAGSISRIYTKFLAQDHVDALLSPYGSALAGPASQLAERYKTPMAHSQTSSPDVFTKTKWSVMAGLGPGSTVLAGVPAFAKLHNYTKIALVNNDLDAYSQICDGAAAAAKAAGATIVSRTTYAITTSDFSSVALKIKNSQPEAVIECSAIQDTIGITRAMSQQGFRPKVIASATAEDPAFLKSLGSLANKAIGYSIWAPTLKLAGGSQFTAAFQARYHAAPSGQSAAAYATVQVLAAAIKKAGSTDKAKVNDALHSGSFPTVLGTYKVDASGVQQGYKPVLDQYQDGKLVIVYPKSSASVDAKLPY